MKTLAIAAFSFFMFATTAQAAGPQATLVFEGRISSVTPGGDHTITGPGGSALPKGVLLISSTGKVTTTTPVIFEVHSTIGDDTVTPKTNYKVTLISSILTAGDATVDNSANVVMLNNVKLVPNVESTAFNQPQASVTFSNDAGFTVADVGAGGIVQANVMIMIEPPTATPPAT